MKLVDTYKVPLEWLQQAMHMCPITHSGERLFVCVCVCVCVCVLGGGHPAMAGERLVSA